MCLDTQWKTVYHSPVKVVDTTNICTMTTCTKWINTGIYYSEVKDIHSRCFLHFCIQNTPKCHKPNKARTFLRRGRQPEEKISRTRTVLSPRFLCYSFLMAKRYLTNVNAVVWGQVKSENSSLPVAVRVSKMRVLKLPNNTHTTVVFANQILSPKSIAYLSLPSVGHLQWVRFNAVLPFTSERWRFNPQIIEYNEREG